MLSYNYIDHKKDHTLILLHGYLSSSKFWDRFIPYFDEFNILTVDLPGHGASLNTKSINTLAGYADKVCEVIQLHVKGNFYLLGQSLGGYIVSEIAKRNIDNLSKIIILNSPNNPELHEELNDFLIEQGKSIDVNDYKKATIEMTKTMEQIITKIFKFLDIEVDISRYNLSDNKDLIEIIVDIAEFNIENNLKALNIPILILSSDNDKSQDITSYKKLSEINNNIHVQVIKNSWHHKFADYPEVCRVITSFCNN